MEGERRGMRVRSYLAYGTCSPGLSCAAYYRLPSSPCGPFKLKLITIVWAYNESN